MNLNSRSVVRFSVAVLIAISAIKAQSDQHWFGGAEDVAFAEDLWTAMRQAGLVGKDAIENEPYIGTHPHGAILESSLDTIIVNGVANMIASKRSYRGDSISIEAVTANRAAYLEDITVMFKREEGYDTSNQNWFWAKYNAEGVLGKTPQGVYLAGRVAKGKPKGCIACHLKAPGSDFLFMDQ